MGAFQPTRGSWQSALCLPRLSVNKERASAETCSTDPFFSASFDIGTLAHSTVTPNVPSFVLRCSFGVSHYGMSGWLWPADLGLSHSLVHRKKIMYFWESVVKWQIYLKSFLLKNKMLNDTMDVEDSSNETGKHRYRHDTPTHWDVTRKVFWHFNN